MKTDTHNTNFDPTRTIDFKSLRKKARPYMKSTTLEEAALIGVSLDALDCWEQCGGRNLRPFHDLLDTILAVISPEGL